MISRLVRYLKLYLHLASFSVKRSLEFRVEFLFRIVMDLAYAAAAIGAYAVIYSKTNSLAGWTYQETMIFVASWLVVDGLQMIFFNANLANFPLLVNRGDLDYYIIRPVSTLFLVSLNYFTLNSCVNLLIWCGYLYWTITNYNGSIPTINFISFVFLLLNGAVLYYIIRMLFLIPVFWLHSALGLEAMFYSSMRLGERPDDIYSPWLRRILMSIVPFALMASFPTKILLSKLTLWNVLWIFIITILLFLVLLVVWNIAIKHYSSASS